VLVPALIADLGDQAGWRYVEFFTANIRIRATRTHGPAESFSHSASDAA